MHILLKAKVDPRAERVKGTIHVVTLYNRKHRHRIQSNYYIVEQFQQDITGKQPLLVDVYVISKVDQRRRRWSTFETTQGRELLELAECDYTIK